MEYAGKDREKIKFNPFSLFTRTPHPSWVNTLSVPWEIGSGWQDKSGYSEESRVTPQRKSTGQFSKMRVTISPQK